MSVKEKGIAGLLKSGSFRKFVIDFRRRIVSVTVTRKVLLVNRIAV